LNSTNGTNAHTIGGSAKKQNNTTKQQIVQVDKRGEMKKGE
jgi:hypothetical protein